MKLSALRVENLACERGGRTLFRDLSFTVERGHALVLTGPNGVGKTSLLRVLAGLLGPGEGRVRIEGGDPEASLPEQSHLIGMREALKPSLTVVEHIRFWRELLAGDAGRAAVGVGEAPSRSDQDEAGAAEALLGRQAHLPVAYLSSGQRRRLALARLSCVERSIWLLDEPLNALDAGAREAFQKRFSVFLAQGGVIVAASHEPLDLPRTRTLALQRDMAGIAPQTAP